MNLQQHIIEWLDSIGADGLMDPDGDLDIILKENLAKYCEKYEVLNVSRVPAYRHADRTYRTTPEHWFLCKTCICDCMPIGDNACNARFDARECTPYQSWLAHKEAKPMEKGKVRCTECNWRGTEDQILVGDNPFDKDIGIVGCPSCRNIDSISCVCDEEDCWELSSCGTPTKEGYRSTCYKHMPKESTK